MTRASAGLSAGHTLSGVAVPFRAGRAALMATSEEVRPTGRLRFRLARRDGPDDRQHLDQVAVFCICWRWPGSLCQVAGSALPGDSELPDDEACS